MSYILWSAVVLNYRHRLEANALSHLSVCHWGCVFLNNCLNIIPHQYIYNAWMACTQRSCVWIPFCGGLCVDFAVLPSESYNFTDVTVAKYSIDTRTTVKHEHDIYKSNHIIKSLIIPEDFKTNASIATMLTEPFVISCDCNNVENLTDMMIKFPNCNYNSRYFVSWWCFHKLLRYFVDIHGKFIFLTHVVKTSAYTWIYAFHFQLFPFLSKSFNG